MMSEEPEHALRPISSWAFAVILAAVPSADEFDVNKAKAVCEAKGQLSTKGPVQVEGYFRSIEVSELFTVDDIAKDLVTKRFGYVEIDQRWWTDPRNGRTQLHEWEPIKKQAVGNGTRYFRFYLAPKDSPSCAGFTSGLVGNEHQRLPSLRSVGLPKNLCIASEKTDELRSRYEMLVESTKLDFANAAHYWSSRLYIRNRGTGEVQAEVTSVSYDPGQLGKGFRCPNNEQVKRFYDEVLVATPNSLLPQPNRLVIIDEPEPFPIVRETAAVLLAEHESIKKMRESEFYSAIHPIAEGGDIFFIQKYNSGSFGLSLVGYYIQIIGDGITKKVLIHVGEHWFWDFQKLLVGKTNLTFVAHPRNWTPKKLELWLLQYSRAGDPLQAEHVTFPEVALQGEVRWIITDLEIHADHYIMKISDLSKDNLWFKVVKEYTFKVPRDA